MKTTKLEKLSACSDAIEWVKTQKSPADAWQNCSRGDWMLWIAKKLGVDDRLLTLAKATCVNQVRHLMTDQRSIDALDACFRYAKGEITREELNTTAAYAASYAAYDAAYAAYAASSAAYAYDAATYAASSAAYAAAYDAYAAASSSAYAAAAAAAAYDAAAYASAYASAAYAAAYDAAAAYAAAAASAAAYAARQDSLKKSADICREILTDVVLQKYKKLRYAKNK